MGYQPDDREFQFHLRVEQISHTQGLWVCSCAIDGWRANGTETLEQILDDEDLA